MKLRTTTINHFRMLSSLILITALWLGFIVYYKLNDSKFLWIISIIYLGAYLIPTLYIHFNYSAKSNNVTFEIDNAGITKTENGETLFYKNSEIEEIIIYGTAKKLKNSGFSNFVFENYFYVEIKLKENASLIVTSLFSAKIDEILCSNFSDKTIRKVKLFYPKI